MTQELTGVAFDCFYSLVWTPKWYGSVTNQELWTYLRKDINVIQALTGKGNIYVNKYIYKHTSLAWC